MELGPVRGYHSARTTTKKCNAVSAVLADKGDFSEAFVLWTLRLLLPLGTKKSEYTKAESKVSPHLLPGVAQKVKIITFPGTHLIHLSGFLYLAYSLLKCKTALQEKSWSFYSFCLEPAPSSMLRDHTSQNSMDSMGCQGLNLGKPCASKHFPGGTVPPTPMLSFWPTRLQFRYSFPQEWLPYSPIFIYPVSYSHSYPMTELYSSDYTWHKEVQAERYKGQAWSPIRRKSRTYQFCNNLR